MQAAVVDVCDRIKVKYVNLTRGRYIYVCPCGFPYRVMTITAKCPVAVYCFDCEKQIGKHYRIMEQTLEFTCNWNGKLNCLAFTTIRLHNPVKYCIGAVVNVYLKGIYKGRAEIIDVRCIHLDQVNEFIAQLDTGYSKDAYRTLIRDKYKTKRIDWNIQLLDLCLLQFKKEKSPTLF